MDKARLQVAGQLGSQADSVHYPMIHCSIVSIRLPRHSDLHACPGRNSENPNPLKARELFRGDLMLQLRLP